MTVKAIAMISGGLDSSLALALMKRQGIEIKAINFYTGFCITETQRRNGGKKDGSIPRNEALRAAADLEVDIEYIDISDSGYLDVIVNPKYGYGANANPCVDCRIDMMSRARKVMEAEGADFIFTGEVLGQRPKSQKRETLRLIEKKSGLDGRLLRPLSAKLLPPTIPELEGKVRRELLLDISGRSRAKQIGVQFNLPLYAGGGVQSRVREAILMRAKAEAELEVTKRQIVSQLRQAFSSLLNGQIQIEALNAAALSSKSSVDANKIGYQIGTRINTDVLNAEQQLFATVRDLYKTRADTIMQTLRLKAAHGTLGETDVQDINLLLKDEP